MSFKNTYEDASHAAAYAQLEFANTYYLAYRDIPEIVRTHVTGATAVDFGCGTGRSTRFLRQLGFNVIGIDISPEMIAHAREADPGGDYRLIENNTPANCVPPASADLVLSMFTFDNIPGLDTKVRLFQNLRELLNPSGKIVSIVSAPEIYFHEWASFSTADFPENRAAQSGDTVRIITTDFANHRLTTDILCTPETYADIYSRASLTAIATHQPLATGTEPYRWVNETRIAPWTIYVLAK